MLKVPTWLLRKSEQYWLCCCMSRITSGHNATLTNNSFGSKCPLQPSNVTFRYYRTPTAYIAEMEIKQRSHCQRSMSIDCQTRVISCYQRSLQWCLNVTQSSSDLEEWHRIWQCAPKFVLNFQITLQTQRIRFFCIATVKCFHFTIWYGCFLNCYQLLHSSIDFWPQ